MLDLEAATSLSQGGRLARCRAMKEARLRPQSGRCCSASQSPSTRTREAGAASAGREARGSRIPRRRALSGLERQLCKLRWMFESSIYHFNISNLIYLK